MLEPKTPKSRRKIHLTELAVKAIKYHRMRQNEARLIAGLAWSEQGWVFCNTVGRLIDAGNLIRRSFRPLLVKAGLPIMRFHELRHSAASLLLSMNVHPRIVQDLLGHSNVSTTLDIYSHVLPSLQEEMVSRLNTLLSERAFGRV
ncbi:MAG TPA: site-specific integrase [Ktedonobacteraceae bacterium]